jgi:hypothetical protein
MHEPLKKRKLSTEINIYREVCRNIVASHPKLHPNYKVPIMRLTDYINRKTWDTFVGEATLAKDCHVSVRAIERALKAARDLGIIERTVRGNQYIGPSHYVFRVSAPDERDQCTRRVPQSAPDDCVNLTSDKHLNKPYEDRKMEVVGERGPAGPKSEPRIPRPSNLSSTPLGEPRFTMDSFRAEMAHKRLARPGRV